MVCLTALILALAASSDGGSTWTSTASSGGSDAASVGVETATRAAGGDAIGDAPPLSEEELALLRSLEAETATAAIEDDEVARTFAETGIAIAARPDGSEMIEVPRARLRDSVPRTIAEAIDALPLPFEASRRFVPSDSAMLRGQTGHRVGLLLDGIPLESALDSSRDTSAWVTLDPWFVDEVSIARAGRSGGASSPSAGAGSLAMRSTPAPAPRAEDSGAARVEAAGEVEARSADRSTGTHAGVAASTGWGAIRIGGGYDDYRALRLATSGVGFDGAAGYQREAASARARLFGRASDPVRIDAGFDVDRLLNVVRTDLGGLPFMPVFIDRARDRTMLYSRIELGGAELGGALAAARQTFARSNAYTDIVSMRYDTHESATTLFAHAEAHWSPVPELRLQADALALGSDASIPTASDPLATPLEDNASARRLSGAISAAFLSEQFAAHAALSIVNLASRAGGASVETTRALVRSGARVALFGPVGFRASFSQSAYVPTPRDLMDASGGTPLSPERSFTVDGGPSIVSRAASLEVLGFYTRLSDAIEPSSIDSAALVNVGQVQVVGVEVFGAVRLFDRLRLAGALDWSEGQDRATSLYAVAYPSVNARASARWDFVTRRAFVEMHVKTTTNPLTIWTAHAPDPPASLAAIAPVRGTRVGFTGGTELGLGFSLRLTIENVLDAPHREPTSLVPGNGVDLRAALAYEFR
jgi:TonB-dependent receptor-like protein